MSILQRYVQREFLKILLICFSGLLGIYFLVDFFQRIDLFLNYPTPVSYKLLYFLLKIPLFVYHITPVAVLVSLLVTLGLLNRNREITAIKCGGITLFHICYPLVLWGLFASGFVFVTNEFVVPFTTRKSHYVLDVLIKGKPPRSIFRQNGIWYYGENNTIFNIQLLDPLERTLEGITLYRFDPATYRLVERIDARTAKYQDGRWQFQNGTIRTFRDDGRIAAESFAQRTITIREKPEDISQYREDPSEMNYPALADYIRKLRRSGFNPESYVVDLQAKASLPLVSLVVAILAIPFAFRAGPSGGIVASLGASLTLGFTYWIVISIGISLGHAAKLAPLFAAWLPNLFFLTVGLYLWLNLEQ